VPWFWNKQSPPAKTKKLSYEKIQRLRKIGEDYADFVARGQGPGGATPSKILDSSKRSEIRAGLIEHLISALSLGAPFEQQIKWVKAVEMLFCYQTFVFDVKAAGGEREIETRELRKEYLGLWDEFQDLIVKDEGRKFEFNEDEIREKIVIKLIEQTKNP
jgi:hypothetical protein